MHRILNLYSEYPAKSADDKTVSNHVSLTTLLRKANNKSVDDISKDELIKLIMNNLHKTYSESESILAIESDPIKACLKLLADDTKTFKDFLTHHENKEIAGKN